MASEFESHEGAENFKVSEKIIEQINGSSAASQDKGIIEQVEAAHNPDDSEFFHPESPIGSINRIGEGYEESFRKMEKDGNFTESTEKEYNLSDFEVEIYHESDQVLCGADGRPTAIPLGDQTSFIAYSPGYNGERLKQSSIKNMEEGCVFRVVGEGGKLIKEYANENKFLMLKDVPLRLLQAI